VPDPRVSVVIPARDDAEHLGRCLRALAVQTIPPWEVLVVDNASTDDTRAVAVAHGARVVAEPRVGIPAAAATGYDAAHGEVIARLDADSVPPPDWVARVGAAMSSAPLADAVTGTGVFYDAPPGLGRPLAAAYLGAYYLLGMAGAGHHVLWGSNMALRREVWQGARDRVHRHEAEVHDDMDLALVLGPGARIRLVPGLTVGVSARSLVGAPQLRRRFRRAFRTLELNWADAPPWERWALRLGGRRPPRTGRDRRPGGGRLG
jgi:glycosyltransferase involved in cell wall biosynthesis